MAVQRWQFEVPDQQAAQLKSLRQACGITTQKDLLNSALTLFQWAVKEITRGRIVASVDEHRMQLTEFSMPPFEVLRATSSYAQQPIRAWEQAKSESFWAKSEFTQPYGQYHQATQQYQPVGTGVGAAAGGAMAGAASGAVAGPVGVVTGAAVGAIAGGLARAVGEAVNPKTERQPMGSQPVGTGVGAAAGTTVSGVGSGPRGEVSPQKPSPKPPVAVKIKSS